MNEGRLKIVIEDEFGTPIHFELDFDGVDELDNALEMLSDSIVLIARNRDSGHHITEEE